MLEHEELLERKDEEIALLKAKLTAEHSAVQEGPVLCFAPGPRLALGGPGKQRQIIAAKLLLQPR